MKAPAAFSQTFGIRAADVPRLKEKWAFSMPGGGQPIVIGDWLFITNRGGKFYALDAKTGCVHWAIEDASSLFDGLTWSFDHRSRLAVGQPSSASASA